MSKLNTVFLSLGLGGLLVLPVASEPLADNQARFGTISGDVGVLPFGAADWITPTLGMAIEPGDQIRTADDGLVEVILTENLLLLIESDSEFVAETTSADSGRSVLRRGGFLARLDSAATARAQNWEFSTPTAVCGVRGTEFALSFSPEDGSRLGVFEGEVDIRPAEGVRGAARPTRIRTFQEAVVPKGKAVSKIGRFTPAMEERFHRRGDLRARHLRIRQTWTPWTPTIRQENRLRYVQPAAKVKRRPPARRRKAPSAPVSE